MRVDVVPEPVVPDDPVEPEDGEVLDPDEEGVGATTLMTGSANAMRLGESVPALVTTSGVAALVIALMTCEGDA